MRGGYVDKRGWVRTHGLVATYKAGCKCERCTEANREAIRRWRRGLPTTEPRVHGIQCRCGQRIVPCDGRYGDWKHIDSNREHCPDMELAAPALAEWKRVPC